MFALLYARNVLHWEERKGRNELVLPMAIPQQALSPYCRDRVIGEAVAQYENT